MKPLSFPSSPLTRREWLKLTTAGVIELLHVGLAGSAGRRSRHGPQAAPRVHPAVDERRSQPDGHLRPEARARQRRPFKEIATAVPGMRISEHLPKLAKLGQHLAIVRSMSTKEADHGRATYTMRTGHAPGGPIQYPALGALVAKELEPPDAELPGFVSIAPFRFLSPGAYGPASSARATLRWSSARTPAISDGQQPTIKRCGCRTSTCRPGSSLTHAAARVQLLDEMEEDFLAERPGVASLSHRTAYQRAVDHDAARLPPRRSTSTRNRRSCATATAGTCSARAACWPAGWWSAACRLSR